jgi:hypothetical protein
MKGMKGNKGMKGMEKMKGVMKGIQAQDQKKQLKIHLIRVPGWGLLEEPSQGLGDLQGKSLLRENRLVEASSLRLYLVDPWGSSLDDRLHAVGPLVNDKVVCQ